MTGKGSPSPPLTTFFSRGQECQVIGPAPKASGGKGKPSNGNGKVKGGSKANGPIGSATVASPTGGKRDGGKSHSPSRKTKGKGKSSGKHAKKDVDHAGKAAGSKAAGTAGKAAGAAAGPAGAQDCLGQPLPADSNGRIKYPFKQGGKFKLVGKNEFHGLFCAECGQDSNYDQICHRMCLKCNAQFPKVIQSARMLRFPHRPDVGETVQPASPSASSPAPGSAEAILADSAGAKPPAMLLSAAAVIISNGGPSTAIAAPRPDGGGKPPKDEEKATKKEALRLEWVKWKDICSEDTARGGLPIPVNVEQVDRAKKAFNDFEKYWKGDHLDKGKKLVDTAAAFFKADSAVKKCGGTQGDAR